MDEQKASSTSQDFSTEETYSNTPTQNNLQPSSKRPYIVALGAILILLVLTGWYFLNKKQNTKLSSIPNTVSISQAPQPTVKTDETTNWKTYTSSLGGFSIKYPQKWLVDGFEGTKTIVSPQSDIIYFYSKSPSLNVVNGDYMCVQLRITDTGDNYPIKDSKAIKELDGGLKINQTNVHAVKNTFPELELTKNELTSIDLPTGKKLTTQASFNCIQGDIDNVKLTYDQQIQSNEYKQAIKILSTFKLKEKSQSDSAVNPKVYKSTRAGYELKYPSAYSISIVPDWNGQDPGVQQEVTIHDSSMIYKGDSMVINIIVKRQIKYTNPSDLATQEGEPKEQLKESMLGAVKASYLEMDHGKESENPFPFLKRVYAIKNGDGYIIQASAVTKSELQSFDQILSTFKFL